MHAAAGATGSDGDSPAAAAVALLRLLLARGGAPDTRDINRWTPLHHAAWHGHVAAIQVLFDAGADMDAKDRWSRPALAWAVLRGHVAAVEALFRRGARPNAVHHKGRDRPQNAHLRRQRNTWCTILHLAVQAVVLRSAPLALLATVLSSGLPINVKVCVLFMFFVLGQPGRFAGRFWRHAAARCGRGRAFVCAGKFRCIRCIAFW
jgi:hypothetical protein